MAKRGLKSKDLRGNTGKKKKKQPRGDMRGYWKRIAKKSFEQMKQDGDVTQHTNPKGKTYWWFSKGRRVCLDTKLKRDPDGFSQYSTGGDGIITPRLKRKLRK